MRIPVIGSGTVGVLSDAKVFVTIKGGTAANLVKSIFPSTQMDAAGNIVIEQDAGSPGGWPSQIIQSVEVDSTILDVILGVVVILFVGLAWLAIRKH